MKQFLLLAGLILGIAEARSADPQVVPVWPGKAPGETAALGEEKVLPLKPGDKQVKRIANVTQPTLTIYRAATEKSNGAAVIIAPGGGYNILAWDLEGEEVAQWLNSLGVTGIVLKYRVPRRPDQPKGPPLAPLQDAQRALSLVRSKSKEWGIDPNRIGMLGFSAGGHLTANASTNYDKRAYPVLDGIDKVSSRPDFAILVYPGGVISKDTNELSSEIRVTKETPPSFLVHAYDDKVPAENSIQYFLALKKAGVPAELHVYSTGGHGFGLRPSDKPVSAWKERAGEWLKQQGYLKAK